MNETTDDLLPAIRNKTLRELTLREFHWLLDQVINLRDERDEFKNDLQTLEGRVRQGLAEIDRSFPKTDEVSP